MAVLRTIDLPAPPSWSIDHAPGAACCGMRYRGESRKRISGSGLRGISLASLIKLNNSLPLNAHASHQTLLAKNERIDI
jgi:hypothetical protein